MAQQDFFSRILFLPCRCFKCVECGKVQNASSYKSMNGIIYCRPHFEQLVKQKGVSDRVWGGVSDLVNESARVYRRGVRPDRSPPSR